jgi:hypothetical protein
MVDPYICSVISSEDTTNLPLGRELRIPTESKVMPPARRTCAMVERP